jgi:ribosomal protein S5
VQSSSKENDFFITHDALLIAILVVSVFVVKQVPVGSNQKFFSFLQVGPSKTNVGLGQNKVRGEKFNVFLFKGNGLMGGQNCD